MDCFLFSCQAEEITKANNTLYMYALMHLWGRLDSCDVFTSTVAQTKQKVCLLTQCLKGCCMSIDQTGPQLIIGVIDVNGPDDVFNWESIVKLFILLKSVNDL